MAKKNRSKSANKPKTAVDGRATPPLVNETVSVPVVKTAPDAGAVPAGFFSDRTNLYVTLALVIGCFVLYGQTVGFHFISIDDGGYVFENPMVAKGLSWGAIKWAFTTYSQANWHPLTWISYLLDSTIFGVRPGAFHLVNVLLHTANSVFLFYLLNRMTGSKWRSAMVAALFAFHPAHVESVAWVAERKDVLSTFFWLLATYFYVRYTQSAGANVNDLETQHRRRNFYLLTIVGMALGIMAKPMVVTLPFTLLLLDFWPLKRLERPSFASLLPLINEKIPLFALSAISSVLTVVAQRQGGAVVSLEALSFQTRALNALVAYGKYFVMMFYPVKLGMTYPYDLVIPAWQITAAGSLLAIVTLASIRQYRERKYLLVGWIWFVGTLVPVIGLVQVGAQSLADRYTYVPFIGLAMMIVWGAAELLRNVDRRIVAAAAAAVLLVCTGLTFRQVRFWRDSEPLYLHTDAVTKNNGFIEQSLCLLYMDQNRFDEAEAQCNNSIAHFPNYYTPHKLLGLIDFKRGNTEDAAKHFARALQLKPDDLGLYSDFTVSQLVQGSDMTKAAEMTDRLADALAAANVPLNNTIAHFFVQNYYLLGLGYSQQNNFEKAAFYFGKSLALNENDSDLRSNYGIMLYKAGKTEEGRQQIERSIQQSPDVAETHNMLGTILSTEGHRNEAIREFERAIELEPDYTAAKNNLDKVKNRP